ncbi:MAG: protein of unknown function transrane [Candidatus Saccharibacteria bacterium]|nr:protein of unknown function transrane [Candidatus Saccharibacteria bacterium]
MWILLALLSALFYASSAMVTKFSVSKVVRDQSGIVAVHSSTAIIFIALIWLLRRMPTLSSHRDILLATVSGFVVCAASTFYFKAFNIEDASVITLLTQAIVPITLIFGFVVLRDKAGPLQLLAAAIILTGVVLSAWSRKGFHLHSTKVIPIMLAATVLTSTSLIIAKSVVSHNNIVAYVFYETLSYAVFGVLYTVFHPKIRKSFMKNMKPFHPRMIIVIGLSEVFYTLAIMSQFKAFTYTNAGLVISVGASEVFLAIILGVVLTKLLPHMINEKIDKKTLGRKFVAGCLIVSGIVMLNFV